MRKSIAIIVASAFLTGICILGCESSAQKVEAARNNVDASNYNAFDVKSELNQAVKDSTHEFQKFQKESEDRISNYEKNIADIKLKIAKEKRSHKSEYQKMVSDLEVKTAELKKDLKEYKVEGKEKLNAFKTKFSSNLEDLGQSISNFFTEDKK